MRCIAFVAVLALLHASNCTAADRGIRFGQETISTWRFGVVVKAPAGAINGIRATLPVPMDWPEQTVKKISEEKHLVELSELYVLREKVTSEMLQGRNLLKQMAARTRTHIVKAERRLSNLRGANERGESGERFGLDVSALR